MKIDQAFKDAKSLLDIEIVMRKKLEQVGITLALVLVAYAMGLMANEAARGAAYSNTAKVGYGKRQVRTLFRTVCVAQEAILFHSKAMTKHLG